MAQSIDEVEYVSAPMKITQVIWLGRIMEGTDEKQKDATRLYYDKWLKIQFIIIKRSISQSNIILSEKSLRVEK
jgi:hypothetical protein